MRGLEKSIGSQCTNTEALMRRKVYGSSGFMLTAILILVSANGAFGHSFRYR